MAGNQQDRGRAAGGVQSRTAESKIRDILEYGTTFDETLPPTPLKDLLAAGGANVFLLSVDPALIDTVQRAGGDQLPVFAVAEWSELETAVDSGQCGIALLDTALLGERLPKRVAELGRYAARLVVLVAADRADAQQLIGLLSERKIHRLLIKPPALGITRLLLESAVGRCIQLRNQNAGLLDATGARRVAAAPPARAARVPTWVLATAIASLLLGVAVVAALTSVWRPSAPVTEQGSNATAPAAVAAVPAPSDDRFGDLLARADRAFNEGRLAAPPGDNALDYYLTILAADPSHSVARDKLGPVVDALFTQAEAALLDNSLDTAVGFLASVRRADPTSSRLAFLDAQVERARAGAPPAAPRAASAAPVVLPPSGERTEVAAANSAPTELDSLLTIAAARLARGQLIEPVGDGALQYVERATRLDATDARVVALRASLASELLDAARAALRAQSIDVAARELAEARRLGAPSDRSASLDADLAAARSAQADRRRSDQVAAARERIRNGALVEPRNDSALHYVALLRESGTETADVRAVRSDLAQALATNARAALARSDWGGGERWLAALDEVDRDSATTQTLARQLRVGRQQEQYLATASPASELKLIRRSAPVYPVDAQARGITGWVELQYVVDRTGRPQNVVVVQGEPPGRFDQAAIAAIAQYQYEPFQVDGQAYDRRIRLRVNFTLQ